MGIGPATRWLPYDLACTETSLLHHLLLIGWPSIPGLDEGAVVFNVAGYSTINDLVGGANVVESTTNSRAEGHADNATGTVRRGCWWAFRLLVAVGIGVVDQDDSLLNW